MNMFPTWTQYLSADEFVPVASAPKPLNTRSQETARREVRRRSNLPKAIQKRLGVKSH